MSTLPRLRSAAVALPMLLLTAQQCERRAVSIYYTPLASCSSFRDGFITTGPADGILLIYRIDRVENTGANALDFELDPARFVVDPGQDRTPGSAERALTTVQPQRVAAGATLERPLGRVAVVYRTDDPARVERSIVPLHYRGHPSLSVRTTSDALPTALGLCTPDNVPS